MVFTKRRVVTGHDDTGRAVFLSDGPPTKVVEIPGSFAISEVLYLDGRPSAATDGGDSTDEGFGLHPEPGGATFRIIRFPPPPADAAEADRWIRIDVEEPDRPGMHTTDTLDFEIILDGEIVLGLDDGDHHLRAGDVVIQRATAHRWGVVGDRPCTYMVVMLRPDPSAPAPAMSLTPRSASNPAGLGFKRLVTGIDANGRSYAVDFGEPPVVFAPGGGGGSGEHSVVLADLWQTGGALATPGQGGDADSYGPIEPLGAGVSFKYVELPAGHEPGEQGWHTTATIDVDVILSGRMELSLPDVEPVVLEAGDVVIQRATHHRWRPVGDEPVRMAAVMLGLG
jgi:quercetin dioxygenase-like cupin family protein